jgi:hypothetical protein
MNHTSGIPTRKDKNRATRHFSAFVKKRPVKPVDGVDNFTVGAALSIQRPQL